MVSLFIVSFMPFANSTVMRARRLAKTDCPSSRYNSIWRYCINSAPVYSSLRATSPPLAPRLATKTIDRHFAIVTSQLPVPWRMACSRYARIMRDSVVKPTQVLAFQKPRISLPSFTASSVQVLKRTASCLSILKPSFSLHLK